MSNALSPSTRHLRTRHLRAPLAANAAAQPEDVLTAKTLLLRLGYYETPEWGISPYPDAALFKAVRAFQSAQGLAADGIIKPEGETEAALHAAATRLQSLDLQSMGRNGDTLLAHITPAEARLLDTVTDGGSINPQTGLLEFFTTGGFASRGLNASSLGGNAKNKDRDSGGSRQKTYTDAQLAGAARANAEAAHTREKVRSYLDRSAASANDRVTPRINERANQQAPARTAANTERQRETHRETQAALARGLAAAAQGVGQNADLGMKQDAGVLTKKSTSAPSFASAPSANRNAAPATPAMPSFKQAAHNTTPSNAAALGVDPSWGPSATPAQQARNIARTRTFTPQQRDAEANANAAAARARQTSRDFLAAKNIPAKPVGNGGTWLDSVQAQTGYPLSPATDYEHKLRIIDPKNPSVINRALNSFWDWIEKDKSNNLTHPLNNPHGIDVSTEAVKTAIIAAGMREAGKTLSTFGDKNPSPAGKIVGKIADPIGFTMETIGDTQVKDFLDPDWVTKTKKKLDPKNRR